MASVLRVSDAAALALHTTVMLAACKQRIVSTVEIAETLHASEAHLAKVLQRLHKAGLVESVRGPKGGFRLSKAGDQITMLEVYEAIEGPLAPSTCLLATRICDGSRCILGDLLRTVNSSVREYLSKTRLSDLVGIFRNLCENL